MVKNLSSRSEGEERPRDGAVDLLHINEPNGEFFTTPIGVLHHARNDHSSPQAKPVLHYEPNGEFKIKLKSRSYGPAVKNSPVGLVVKNEPQAHGEESELTLRG